MVSSTKPIDLRDYSKQKRFFSGAGRGELLAQLQLKIQSPELQICVVSGPSGIGKTALLNELLDDMRPVTRIISFSGHYGTIEKVLEHIAENLNITLDPEHSTELKQQQISRYLAYRYHDKPLLVLFDDAHALPLPVIRGLISVLSVSGSSNSVLFVDNEAVDVVCRFLHQQNIECMNVRRVYREELAAYLRHHYHRAVGFTDLELDKIYKASEGVPRRINQQAEYCLRQRSTHHDLAEKITRVAVPTSRKSGTISFNGAAGWATAACFTVAVSISSFYDSVPANSESPGLNEAGGDRALVVDLMHEEEEESYLATDDEFDDELPEEFVEFSDQLSSDEIELLQAGSDQYVVQLMAGSSEADMEAFIAEHADYDLKMYRSLADGEPWYKAVTAEYDNPDQAIEAATELPQELRQEQPWVRTVASVQQEILQMGEVHLSEQEERRTHWLAALEIPAALTAHRS